MMKGTRCLGVSRAPPPHLPRGLPSGPASCTPSGEPGRRWRRPEEKQGLPARAEPLIKGKRRHDVIGRDLQS